jgi:hypothetical protein
VWYFVTTLPIDGAGVHFGLLSSINVDKLSGEPISERFVISAGFLDKLPIVSWQKARKER